MTLAAVTVSTLDGVPVARVQGEVDASNARTVCERLTEAVPNTAMGMVVDLSATEYLDSSGVHTLFEVADALRRRQQQLHLVVAPDSFIADVMEAVSMGESVIQFASVSDAVDAFNP
jgi:anti-anti-sigma factor